MPITLSHGGVSAPSGQKDTKTYQENAKAKLENWPHGQLLF